MHWVCIILVVTTLFGCLSMAEIERREQEKREAVIAKERKLIDEVRSATLPDDYKEQIDAEFVRILEVPDSRRIEYLENPYGSLMCGTIDVKNSSGDYTGKKPYYAIWLNGLMQLNTLDQNKLNEYRTIFRGHVPVGDTDPYYRAIMFYDECGFK
jgi:hypothetical protein